MEFCTSYLDASKRSITTSTSSACHKHQLDVGEKVTDRGIKSIQPLGPHLCPDDAITLSVYAVSYECLENNCQRVVVEHAKTTISLPFKQGDWLDQSLKPELNMEVVKYWV